MTIQTNNPLLQANGANATAPRNTTPDRLADNARANGGFGATLSREMTARQQTPPPAAQPQAKPAQQQSKPNAADKPATREPVRDNAARAGTKPAGPETDTKTTASAPAPADGKEEAAEAANAGAAEAAAAAAAAAAASTPVTDMLAFMASLTRPVGATADAASVPVDAAATTAGTGELELTALESALDTKAGATVTDDAASEGPGKGFSLAAGVQRAAPDTEATQAQGQSTQVLPDGQNDTAQFQAQLRDTRQQAIAADEQAPAPLAQLQAQAAKLDAVGNPAAVPGDRIPARVGTQAWDNQVSQRIVYMVGKEQAATLTLNPPDLGPVQIVLNVSNDQATVAFSSEQLEVRQALENALPRLREMMSESGIALNNATVDAGAPGRQQQDSERRAQGGNGTGNGNPGDAGGDTQPAVNEVAPRTRTVGLGERGMVDLFA